MADLNSEPISARDSGALVIFSGGQDSTTCLYWALKNFKKVAAITFDYGQRHRIELECAQKLCEKNKVPQKIVAMDFLSQLNANALTDASIKVGEGGGLHNLPSTFVPGRNALFFTMAAAYGVGHGWNHLVTGVCQADFSGYPDCREEFVASMEHSLSLALQSDLKIHRPLMNSTKAEIFALAESLGALESVVLESHTCYEGNRKDLHAWGYGCGECPACKLRARGFEEFIERKSSHAPGRRINA